MGRYVVIGAGPAGISAAWQLARQKEKVLLLEQGSWVGGMSQTFRRGDCLLEFGPHAFHIKDDYMTELIKKLCGENFRVIPTKTHIILKGKQFCYPLEFYQVLMGLNPFFSGKMVLDYLFTSLKNGIKPQPEESFEAWGIRHFGKTLYELSFGQYTERVWGMPPSQLSYKLAQQKLHKLNLKDVIHKLLGGQGEEQKTYFKQFIYPKYGVGEIFEKMVEEIKAGEGEVGLNSKVTEVKTGKNGVVEVRLVENGSSREKSVECDGLISTIPLGTLAQILKPSLKTPVLEAGRELGFRDLILVYFVVNRDYLTDSQWVYLVDEKFKFNRFTEQKNLSPAMLPSDKTVIMFEVCCKHGDELWQAPDSLLYELAMEEVKKLKLFEIEEVIDRFVVKVRDAYPIYDLDFDKKVDLVVKEISKIPNLFSTGRNGLFLNTDIHDAMEMGLLVGEAVREGMVSEEWYEKMTQFVEEKIEG